MPKGTNHTITCLYPLLFTWKCPKPRHNAEFQSISVKTSHSSASSTESREYGCKTFYWCSC